MNTNTKTILLSGYKGFIGSRLLNRLKENPYNRIILLDKGSEIPKDDIDIFYHLGAFTPKNYNEGNSYKEIYKYNVENTFFLLENLSVPKKIVFASTLDVYDSTISVIDENSKINPISFYGSSKFFCEQMFKVYSKSRKSDLSILRYGNVYGPGEGNYKKLIPETIKTLLSGKTPKIYGDPCVLRDFIYIDDIVEATIRVASTSTEEPITLNIVNGASVSVIDIITLLSKITNNFNSPELFPGTSFSRSFNNEKMLSVLGKWKFSSLEEGLINEVNYFRESNV